MNCPQCNLASLPDQKFCRSCGASLQLVTQPLADLAPSADVGIARRNASADARQRASRFVLWGFIIMFLGVALGVIGKKLIHDEIVTVIGILASLPGMFLVVYPYIAPPRRKRELPIATSQPVVLTSAPAKSLPQGTSIEFVPSITERTTNLLKVPSTSSREERKS